MPPQPFPLHHRRPRIRPRSPLRARPPLRATIPACCITTSSTSRRNRYSASSIRSTAVCFRKEPAIRSLARRREPTESNGCGFTSSSGLATWGIFRSWIPKVPPSRWNPSPARSWVPHCSRTVCPFSERAAHRTASRPNSPVAFCGRRTLTSAIAATSTTTASASEIFCKNSTRAFSTASILRNSANCTSAIKRRSS